MKRIIEFVQNNDVDTVENEIGTEQLKQLFASVSFVPGAQFFEFVNKYSYLAFKYVEFFGINKVMLEKSRLFARTKAFIEAHPETRGFYIAESLGDGYFVLVDGQDNIYDYFVGDSIKPEPSDMKFFDYVIKRFEEAAQ